MRVLLTGRLLNINVVKHKILEFNCVPYCESLHRELLSDIGLYFSNGKGLKSPNESGPGCSFCARCDGV